MVNLPDGSAIIKLRAEFGERPLEPFEIFTLKPLPRRSVDFEKLFEEMIKRYGAPATTPIHRIQAQPKIELEELSDEMIEFLRAVSRVGHEGKFKLYKFMRISAKRFDALVEKAEAKGLITIQEVESGGRPLKAVMLTEKDREVIKKFLGRRGGLWHQRAIERVAEYHQKQGDEPFLEKGGRAEEPDLTVMAKDGRRIIWQFEWDASHPGQVIKNFEKFRLECDALCIGVPNDDVGQRVIRLLGSRGYEAGRDYFIYKIPLKEEEGVENGY